eukprot:10385158-Alexandrium_andersonii.AAC.1
MGARRSGGGPRGRERRVSFLHASDADEGVESPCLVAALDADGSSLSALAAALAPVAPGGF